MAYDFSAAVSAATQAVSEKGATGVKYPFPLLYCPKGQTIVVKLLFNPASGQITRLIKRHEFDDTNPKVKVPCYKTYGIECPICKVQEQVQSVLGPQMIGPDGKEKEIFGKSKAKSRGISFAQYISSTLPIETGGKGFERQLKPGETVLFMYPWSVYTQINAMIQAVSQSPSGMEQAFCSADGGLFVQVSSTNDYKYTTIQVPFMTFPTGMSNEQYLQMLDGLPKLTEQVLPETITQDVDAQVKEATNRIYQQYLAPRIPNMGSPATVTTLNTPVAPPAQPQFNYPLPEDDLPFYVGNPTNSAPAAPAVPPVAPAATPVAPAAPTAPVSTAAPENPNYMPKDPNQPMCMGSHQEGNPKCIVCPYELTCIQASAQV